MSGEIRLGDKLPETTIGPFDAAALERYAAVSGDDNPLHLDDALAGKIGLSAPPVHGMKLLAAFEPMLKGWRNDLTLVGLSAKFIQPILRGETVTLSGRVLRVSENEIFLRLFAHGAARTPGVIGEATLRRESPK
ncbi:MaoC family dehydratase [Methylocystis echinoides]|uniref:Enoyl-CoA hydratase n=1 Tax=Methylocystis echinoides TaxID=29468 RepID=A0A9W6LR37_9HYPH|nr:MaoC/PaaZ C-terminal domain-containing protein [Methylocystis echinoides]GLI91869.1 enoyl-CoA hydratase [Methylocystis echinoides]